MRALLGTLLVLLLAAAPAQAVPLLDPADADELAQTLADATEQQGVCYGWRVEVTDGSGGPSGIDVGSNRGVDQPVDQPVDPSCTRVVEVQGAVRYTCDSCEGEDSSGYSVASNFDGGPTDGDLEALGLSPGSLKNEDGDVALINLVGALPLIVASKGQAAAIAPTDDTAPAPGDGPTGSPVIPDVLRAHGPALIFFLLLILGGIAWLVSQVLSENVQRSQRRTQEQRYG